MSKYGNENAAAGGLGRDTASRDRSYGGGQAGAGAGDSRSRNPRYSQNPIASGPLTAHNLLALGNMLAPGGWARNLMGIGPQYSGVTPRNATGFSYDPKNMAFGASGPGGVPWWQLMAIQQRLRQPTIAPVAPMNPFAQALANFRNMVV